MSQIKLEDICDWFSEQKGIELTEDSFEDIHKRYKEYQMTTVLIGEGGYQDNDNSLRFMEQYMGGRNHLDSEACWSGVNEGYHIVHVKVNQKATGNVKEVLHISKKGRYALFVTGSDFYDEDRLFFDDFRTPMLIDELKDGESGLLPLSENYGKSLDKIGKALKDKATQRVIDVTDRFLG